MPVSPSQSDVETLQPPFLALVVVTRTSASDLVGAVQRLTSQVDLPTSTTLAATGDHSLVLATALPGQTNEVQEVAEDVATEHDVIVLSQWAPTLRHARLSYEAIRPSLVDIAARHGGDRRCLTFSEGAFEQCLAGLPLPEGQALLRRILGGVLSLPSATAELLLETAEVLIEESGHQSRAAARFGRHPRSIGNRKRRFTDLTGLDANNIQHRLLILVGLRLLRVSRGVLPPVGDARWSSEQT